MDNLKRPKVVDVEKMLNEFVTENGGKLVSSIVLNPTQSKNADYFFDTQSVIAELKCFQKDLFNHKEDVDKLLTYLKKWKERNLIAEGDEILIRLGIKELPIECLKELYVEASKTIESAIRKANKQIRETKILLDKPNAKGLLLLCNDGNYFLQNNVFISLICNVMQRKYMNSDIDGFVYFTYNQTSMLPNSPLDWNIWVPVYRDENDYELSDFVNNLGTFFNDFQTKTTGIEATEFKKISSPEEGVNIINEMEYIPKDIIYGNRKG